MGSGLDVAIGGRGLGGIAAGLREATLGEEKLILPEQGQVDQSGKIGSPEFQKFLARFQEGVV